MKVAINDCIGGFFLSREAYEYLGIKTDRDGFPEYDLERNDPRLIKCIEALGEKASDTNYSNIVIAEIPDGVEYEIEEGSAGFETIHEKHRKWRADGEVKD